MQFFSRRAAALTGVTAVVVTVAVAAYAFSHNSRPSLPPPLSTAGAAALNKIDIGLGFYLARLNSAQDDAGRVAEAVEQWIKRGRLTADGADFDSALTLLDKADKLIGSDTRLYNERGHVLRARHRFVEARAVARKGLEKYPDDEDLLALEADSALYAGDMREGEAGFRKVLAVNDRISAPWIGLAYWAEITGDLEQAVDLLNRAIEAAYPRPLAYERQAYVHSVLGEVRAKEGDMKEARRQYSWALSIRPDYPAARTGLVDVEQWEGHDAEAEKLLRGLIESESPNADFQIKLADLRERLGDKADAATLRKNAEMFYDWSVATGYDGYLRPLSTLKLADGDYRRAAELAARDLKIRPTTESRAIYQNVLAKAKVAGKPVNESALYHRIGSDVAKVAANP